LLRDGRSSRGADHFQSNATCQTMIYRSSPFLLSLLAVAATACGGSSGGAPPASANPSCDPGEFLVEAPAGLGAFGPMDGVWTVVDVQLIADPRNRNPDIENAWLLPGEQLRFDNGVVVELAPDPNTGAGGSGYEPPVVSGETTVEFLCNEVQQSLTVYGFGATFSGPSGNAAARQCSLIGTTSATTARAIVVQEDIANFNIAPPFDRFMVYEVELDLSLFQPSRLEQGDELR